MLTAMFSVEERDRVRGRLLEMARDDPRVAAGAEAGSMALGQGDRWSDMDLTFGLADGEAVPDVLADWTAQLARELGAVDLFDLPLQTTVYRVFLLPGCLQVDLSFTPGAQFGALGPKFRLLFGTAVERDHPPQAPAPYRFGLAAHHAVRARFCIERGRWWQAHHWISDLRDQALTLACLRRGLSTATGRGYDELPAEVLDRFAGTLVRSVERDELLRALHHAVEGLLSEAGDAGELAAKVESQLRGLTSASWA
jgi:hypothetical protein